MIRVCDLSIGLKGNSKRISGNSLSLLVPQKKDLDAALQMLLTRVKLHLPRRLHACQCKTVNYHPCNMVPIIDSHCYVLCCEL